MISFLTLVASATTTATPLTEVATSANWARALIQLAIIIFIFYLFFIRPQQKRVKEQMQMLASLKVGDEVAFSGFIGKITRIISAGEVEVEIADGVKVKVLRSFVSQVLVEKEEAKPANNKKKK